MARLAIIADDLTGALDAAAPFAGMAGGVVVATKPAALPEALARRPGVVAVSTRSREIDAEAARAQVAAILDALPPDTRLFKKVDSRLKGNIAAELDAFGPVPMLVAPAIPDFGRVVRGGALEGFGVERPVPIRPVLGASAERAGIPDTATNADMAAALDGAGRDAVLVGARGLAMALATSFSIAHVTSAERLGEPVCLVIGSRDPITLRQIVLLRESVAGLLGIEAPSGEVASLPDARMAPVCLLQMTEGGDAEADAAARRFAEGAAPWLRAARSMVLSGGATAEACLDAIGADLLALRGEILPGLPVSESDGRVIVTKSGGFGEPDTLVRLTAHPAAAET